MGQSDTLQVRITAIAVTKRQVHREEESARKADKAALYPARRTVQRTDTPPHYGTEERAEENTRLSP